MKMGVGVDLRLKIKFAWLTQSRVNSAEHDGDGTPARLATGRIPSRQRNRCSMPRLQTFADRSDRDLNDGGPRDGGKTLGSAESSCSNAELTMAREATNSGTQIACEIKTGNVSN